MYISSLHVRQVAIPIKERYSLNLRHRLFNGRMKFKKNKLYMKVTTQIYIEYPTFLKIKRIENLIVCQEQIIGIQSICCLLQDQ